MANGDLMRVDSTIKHNKEPAHWDLKFRSSHSKSSWCRGEGVTLRLTQTRYVHPAAARCFNKMTYCVRDAEGGVKRWAAVAYRWLTQPFTFKPLPHGNCKGTALQPPPCLDHRQVGLEAGRRS